MPRPKAQRDSSSMNDFHIDHATYSQLTDLMDELAFRGRMQEALIVRIANKGGFDEVLARIKRRRLYSKRMDAGAPVAEELSFSTGAKARNRKKATKRARPTQSPGGGSQSSEVHEGD